MKNTGKWIAAGLGAVAALWVFSAFMMWFFSVLSDEGALIMALLIMEVGFFLAFEIMICTGIIVNNRK